MYRNVEMLVLSEELNYGDIINKNDNRIVGRMNIFNDDLLYFQNTHYIFTFIEKDKNNLKILCKI